MITDGHIHAPCIHTQPSLNEIPASDVDPNLSKTPPPSNEGGERKRPAPADGDENVDPKDKPPKAKQPRTIEIELPPPSDTRQDATSKMGDGLGVRVCVHVCIGKWQAGSVVVASSSHPRIVSSIPTLQLALPL